MSDGALDLLDRVTADLSSLRALLTAREPQPAPSAPLPPPPAPPPPKAAPAPSGGLRDPQAFYRSIRASDDVFGGTLTPAQFAGCEADLADGAGKLPLAWMAYCLATDYHESNHTMQPIHEIGSGDKNGDGWDDWLQRYDTGTLAAALGNTPAADGDGVRYAGRGKPQITGLKNYTFANRRLHEMGVLKADEDMVANPDLALRLDVATACLIHGMLEGWFTGKKLNSYLPSTATLEQFTNARRIVNGTDRAALIAKIAMAFQTALQAGGWA